MAGIGSIGTYSPIFNPTKPISQMTSGKKINSAADDAAGMAIAEGLKNQSAGATVASNNAKDMNNLLNLSDGALGQVSEGLDRIRELALQSRNGVYSSSDRSVFQEEINGILEHINDIGKNTQFNGKNVLDGSFTAQSAVIGPNGESMEVNIGSALTDSLGISDFDVTGKFDLNTIDKAIEAVSSQRASVGAQSNRLEYSARAMDNAAYNMEVARSRQEDADMAQASMENNRNKILDQVGISMQKMKMEGMGNFLSLIG